MNDGTGGMIVVVVVCGGFGGEGEGEVLDCYSH